MFSCEFWKNFKNIFFTEHLLVTASAFRDFISVMNRYVTSGSLPLERFRQKSHIIEKMNYFLLDNLVYQWV